MERIRFVLAAAALLAALALPPGPAEAGKILFAECFTARGDTADGVKAALANGGSFYTWGGFSVAGTVVEGKPCTPINLKAGADLFRGENKNGTNSIKEDLKKNVVLDGLMNFRSIRDPQSSLDKDAMKTTFTLKGNDIATKIGPTQTVWKFGDPVIAITNLGDSSMILQSVTAQIFNSEDPLDPDLTFDPDGKFATVTPSLSGSLDILPGETEEFSFSLDGSPNWAFQYSYLFEGQLFTEMIASDVVVPAPGSLGVVLAGIGALVAASARRRDMRRWRRAARRG